MAQGTLMFDDQDPNLNMKDIQGAPQLAIITVADRLISQIVDRYPESSCGHGTYAIIQTYKSVNK